MNDHQTGKSHEILQAEKIRNFLKHDCPGEREGAGNQEDAGNNSNGTGEESRAESNNTNKNIPNKEEGRKEAEKKTAGKRIPVYVKDRTIRSIQVFDELDSTNTYLLEHASSQPDRSVIIARRQSGGRGRNGHSFYSPPDTGLYMSIIWKPEKPVPVSDILKISMLAGVAAARVLENLYHLPACLKWVNDVLIDHKKVAGILCEGKIGGRGMECMVIGIGLNVHTSPFPEELSGIAGSLADFIPDALLDLNRIAAEVLKEVDFWLDEADSQKLVQEASRLSCILGRKVDIETPSERFEAIALALDKTGRLLIEKEGQQVWLHTADIHLFDKSR